MNEYTCRYCEYPFASKFMLVARTATCVSCTAELVKLVSLIEVVNTTNVIVTKKGN